jgi:hypothetical protein
MLNKRRWCFGTALAVLLAALPSCAPEPAAGPDPKSTPPAAFRGEKLTPERAKAALLEMMRSKPGKELGWFDGRFPDKASKMTAEDEGSGWYAWAGAFRFNPSKATYTFTVRPRPGARACTFEYEGSFVRKEGRWLATPPKLVRRALQAGE